MNEPIRILEFRSAGGAGGGPEKTILHGAARADLARFRVTVCYLRKEVDPAYEIGERAARLGLDYEEIRQRSPWDPRVWKALRRVVRDRRIDIIHAHDYKTNLLALLAAKSDGVIPLTTAHGYTGHSWRERYLYYPADRRLLARFPRVLTVSSQLRDELLAAGARPERVTTLLNGIDHEAFRRDVGRVAGARSALGLGPDERAIGAVGRLMPQKRFDLLLDAFAALVARRPTLRLLIAGEGDSRAALESQIGRLGLGRACRLLGHRADVAEFHHALDLYVQSSDYEGTPNVVLEAMALETPVVATDVGGTAELIRREVDGILLPPGDPAALGRAIERAMGEPEETARRVASARRRVENELSFEARCKSLDRVYEGLLAGRRDPARGRT